MTQAGRRTAAEGTTLAADRSVEFLRMMVLIREYEERALRLRRERTIVGPVHPYIGQEAIATGVCAALAERDMMVTNYRGHGHALARGVDLDRFTAELFGRSGGLCGGKACGHFSDRATGILAASGIVAGGVPLAAGAAMGAQLDGDAVVVCFLGDGALGAGVVHEVLTIAAVQALPLLLVCEHNGYQSTVRTEDVIPDPDLARIARGHRVRAVSVDGNDVHAVYAAATDAVAGARRGDGPSFLQMHTYLTRFHIQFDRPSREVRPADEMAAWLARDPIELLWRRMLAGGAEPGLRAELERAAAATVDAAVAWAQASPYPPAGALTADLALGGGG